MVSLGRPPRDPKKNKTTSLRFMLRAEEKNMIRKASQILDKEMTEWSVPILVQAANKVIQKAVELK